MGYKYGSREQSGDYYQAWIDGESTNKKCPVARCQLSFRFLSRGNYRLELENDEESLDKLESLFKFNRTDLHIPQDDIWNVTVWKHDAESFPDAEVPEYGEMDGNSWLMSWAGAVTNSVISLEYLDRTDEPDRVYMSEITDAIYHKLFPHDKLRYIFVYYVINPDTVSFLRDHIYTAANGLAPSSVKGRSVQEWQYNTPEYRGILGTKIGKVVASYVMGHYDPGAVWISSIKTVLEPSDGIDLPDNHIGGYSPHFLFTLSHRDEMNHVCAAFGPETLKRKAEEEPEDPHPPQKKRKLTPADKPPRKVLRRKILPLKAPYISRTYRPDTPRWSTTLLYRTLIPLFLVDLPTALFVDRILLSGYAGHSPNLIEAGWEFFHDWMQQLDVWPGVADLDFRALFRWAPLGLH